MRHLDLSIEGTQRGIMGGPEVRGTELTLALLPFLKHTLPDVSAREED